MGEAKEPLMETQDRVCKTCGVTKPISGFRLKARRGQKVYYSHECKTCAAVKARAANYRSGKTKTPRHVTQPHHDPVTQRMVKRCGRCKTVKPVEEFFREHGRPKAKCKECARAQQKAWYDANAEVIRAKARDYLAAHKETIYPERQARYSALSPEQRTARNRKGQDCKDRYRARQHSVLVADDVQRDQIIERDGALCYLCGDAPILGAPASNPKQLTLDHVIPLVRGGPHSSENLRVACRACNRKKGNLTLGEFQALGI